LVVSPKSFNQRFQLARVCPISGGVATVARESGFLIPLMGSGLRTDGSVHAHQLKSLDWKARKAILAERAPPEIVNAVLECLVAVLEDA
jgi:mRNA interferase ChpB